MPGLLAAYPFLNDPMNIGAAIALIALVVAAVILRSGKPSLARIQPKPLLTANENEFFHRLQRALPSYQVFPQVSFAAILTDDGQLSRKSRWSPRAKFDRKIADFVVCERGSLQIVALIELDDRTHNASADRQGDAITKTAGYQTFRFESKQKPSEKEIAALFQHSQAWG
jgi:hypothetical protein